MAIMVQVHLAVQRHALASDDLKLAAATAGVEQRIVGQTRSAVGAQTAHPLDLARAEADGLSPRCAARARRGRGAGDSRGSPPASAETRPPAVPRRRARRPAPSRRRPVLPMPGQRHGCTMPPERSRLPACCCSAGMSAAADGPCRRGRCWCLSTRRRWLRRWPGARAGDHAARGRGLRQGELLVRFDCAVLETTQRRHCAESAPRAACSMRAGACTGQLQQRVRTGARRERGREGRCPAPNWCRRSSPTAASRHRNARRVERREARARTRRSPPASRAARAR